MTLEGNLLYFKILLIVHYSYIPKFFSRSTVCSFYWLQSFHNVFFFLALLLKHFLKNYMEHVYLALHTCRYQRYWCSFSLLKTKLFAAMESSQNYQLTVNRREEHTYIYIHCTCICRYMCECISLPLAVVHCSRVGRPVCKHFHPPRKVLSLQSWTARRRGSWNLHSCKYIQVRGQRRTRPLGMKPTFKASTHIMRKMPPQFAVQERFIGSSFGFRPRGPRTKPRTLHTTTRRTTQHRVTHTLHLKKYAHMMTESWVFLPLITQQVCTSGVLAW